MRDALAIALELSARGLSVIPVPPPGGGFDGKVPIISWREYQRRRATEEELSAWFAGASLNLAVVTGAISGVVVVDVDSPAALAWIRRRLPYTAWQTQTARGFHLWYRHPGVLVRNRARISTGAGKLALDCRGDGGYVIGPGSVHATGARYEFAGDWTVPRERVPMFWPGWLERPRTSAGVSTLKRKGPRPTGAVVDRARAYLRAIPRPEIGAGSDTAVFTIACRLIRGFEIAESVAIDLLEEWCCGRPGWDRDWITRKVQSAAAYGSEPIGGRL